MIHRSIQIFSKIDSAALLALISTSTAACSTIAYLTIASQNLWGAEFIQLYSIIGLFSGWLNTLIFFFAPHRPFLQSKTSAALIFSLSISLVLFLYKTLFFHSIGPLEITFVASSLTPLLFANAFGVEFSEGNYHWVYVRSIFMNAMLALAAALSWFSENHKISLCYFTSLVGLCILAFWAVDRHRKIHNESVGLFSFQAWLNPSLPILERSVWDQWILSNFRLSELSVWIYLIGRALAFFGNISYSFFLGRFSNLHDKHTKSHRYFILFSLIAFLSMFVFSFFSAFGPILVGQLFSLLLGLSMTIFFRNKHRFSYLFFVAIWLSDLALRNMILNGSEHIEKYFRASIWLTVTEFVILLFCFQRALKLSQEKTNTKFLLGDSQDTH